VLIRSKTRQSWATQDFTFHSKGFRFYIEGKRKNVQNRRGGRVEIYPIQNFKTLYCIINSDRTFLILFQGKLVTQNDF